MTLARLNLCLAALLLVALLIELGLKPSQRQGGPRALFPGLGFDRVVRIELEGPLGSLRLERRGIGPKAPFVLPDLGDFPAQAGAVRGPIDALARLLDSDRVGSGSQLASYGLEPVEALHLTAFDAEGQVLVEVDLSSDPRRGPGSGGAGCFVKPAGQQGVFRAPGLAALRTEPRAFWDGRVLAFAPAQVQGLQFEGLLQGRAIDLSLARDDSGSFLDPDGSLRPKPTVEAFLVALSNLYLDSVERVTEPGPSGDPFFSTARLSLSLASGEQLQLAFGQPLGSGLPVQRSDWAGKWNTSISAQVPSDWLRPGGPLERLLQAAAGR